MCRQKKDTKQEKLNTTTQEGAKEHQGSARLAKANRRVKHGSSVKYQGWHSGCLSTACRINRVRLCLFFSLLPFAEGIEAQNPSSITEVSDLLAFLQEEQSLSHLILEYFFPPAQPLGPTTTIFAVYAQDTLDQHSRSDAKGLRFSPGLCRSVGGKKNPSLASLSGLDPAPHIVLVGGR